MTSAGTWHSSHSYIAMPPVTQRAATLLVIALIATMNASHLVIAIARMSLLHSVLYPVFFSLQEWAHQRFSHHLYTPTLGHKYCKVAHLAPSNRFQAHLPSWSIEARKLNTPSLTPLKLDSSKHTHPWKIWKTGGSSSHMLGGQNFWQGSERCVWFLGAVVVEVLVSASTVTGTGAETN